MVRWTAAAIFILSIRWQGTSGSIQDPDSASSGFFLAMTDHSTVHHS